MATTKKTTTTSKPKPRKRKRDPYANKTIAFDTLNKSIERNPRGTFSFFAMILAIIVFLIAVIFNLVPVLRRPFRILFFIGGIWSASSLDKKPNGLPLIATIIYASLIVCLFIFFGLYNRIR